MGGRYRKAIHVGRRNGARRNQFGRRALTIGQMALADFFADGNDVRFQPIIVPRPSAIATATLTQVGMNFVAASSDCL